MGYSIQQVSEMTGVSAHTLRYYEKIDLLEDVQRDGQGNRCYSAHDVECIEVVKRMKDVGFSLDDIKMLGFDLDIASCRERIKLFVDKRNRIRDDIAALEAQYADVDAQCKRLVMMHYYLSNKRFDSDAGLLASIGQDDPFTVSVDS